MARVLGIIGAIFGIGGLIWYFFFTQAIPGFWILVPEESQVTFSSTKNGDITEQHSIKNIEGSADFTGEFLVRLDLRSVDTGIAIRDERMRDFLFEVGTHPVARIEGSFDLNEFSELEPGQTIDTEMPFTLKMHGVSKEITAAFKITRTEWKKVVLKSSQDILIQAGDFNLTGGIETLRGLAGLEDIALEVPVSFELVFEGGTTPADIESFADSLDDS